MLLFAYLLSCNRRKEGEIHRLAYYLLKYTVSTNKEKGEQHEDTFYQTDYYTKTGLSGRGYRERVCVAGSGSHGKAFGFWTRIDRK